MHAPSLMTKPKASLAGSNCGRGVLTPEAPSIVHDVLRSSGQPLESTTRAFMEPRFGYDFSRVRVHTDAKAAESAAAVSAQAYTVGSNIVFGSGRGGAENKQLLAHELAHVVQQGGRQAGGSLQVAPAQDSAESAADRAADRVLSGARAVNRSPSRSAAALQRRPVTTDLPSVAQYEWTGTEQRKTSTRMNQAYISLSYEPTTGDFTCSFHLRWRFPAAWAEARRAAYIDDFVRVVKAAWESKFPLKKYENGTATSTAARVLLDFDHIRAPDMENENEYLNWLMNDKDQLHNQRWTMNVHNDFSYRDRVDAPSVHLDPSANTPQTIDTSSFKDRTFTSGQGNAIQSPPYQHYFDKGITPSQGTGAGGKYTQTTSAHEFGHMIGLADEYVMSADDYNDLKRAKGQPAADAELGKRRTASNRIENVGGQVTQDAYRPFADFLHTLTAEDWRVG
ncbi:MAG TPA: DUF4157 domain-containing protein [Opitutaceae bacterium]|nr:DUF4157 domain-containing protein [Opitutaceae bacterium]